MAESVRAVASRKRHADANAAFPSASSLLNSIRRPKMLILVTGATGFIAGQLIPRLLERGHRVRALARDPSRLDGKAWARATDIVHGDVMRPETLRDALQGVHIAYYLIHSLASGRDYAARDVEGARNFAQAAAHAGVR